jgi:hypothetical protein
MAVYFSEFYSDLASYFDLSSVCELDTSSFFDRTQVIVINQGIFTWYKNFQDIPVGQFVYPTTFGAGWVKSLDPNIIVGDNGILDFSCLPNNGSHYIPIILVRSYTDTPAQTVTIPAIGVSSGDLVYLSCQSEVGSGVSSYPLAVTAGEDSITLTFNAAPTGEISYNFVVLKH